MSDAPVEITVKPLELARPSPEAALLNAAADLIERRGKMVGVFGDQYLGYCAIGALRKVHHGHVGYPFDSEIMLKAQMNLAREAGMITRWRYKLFGLRAIYGWSDRHSAKTVIKAMRRAAHRG